MQAAILKFLGRFPLRVVLIVPFIVQIFVIVGLIGWLSFRSGQQAVNNVAGQLRQEITARIEDTLNVYLETPHVVNRINSEAIRLGQLDPHNIPNIEKYLWNQIQQFDTVSLIALGTEFGDYIEVQRYQDGALNVAVKDKTTSGDLQIWATDARGNRTNQLNTVSDYDPRLRPWYQAAAETSIPVWTDIYPYFSDKTLAISANQPFYDNREELAAVASTDLTLSQINNFLGSLEVGKTGHTFIMERSGLLVASSTGEPPTVATNSEGELERLNATDSQNPLVSQTVQHLAQQYNSLAEITSSQQLDFNIDGQIHFLQVTPYNDPRGIDWLIVVAIPQSDFMAQINANIQTTVILSVIALVVAIIVGIITARWVVYPILNLNIAAGNLAAGDWNQSIPVDRADELGGLATSFNSMARQLKDSFDTLQTSEEKYRTLFEDSSDTIYISKPDGEIIDINPAGERMLRYSKAELIGKNAQELYLDPEERSKFKEKIEANGFVTDMSIRLVRKDGRQVDALITGTVSRADDGTVQNYHGVVRDITALKRAERERLRLSALEQDLALARDIQQSLLPAPSPNWPNLDVICYSKPAHETGGDLYAYFPLADNKYAVAVGDVSGKGMPAALLMSAGLASLRSTVRRQPTPEALLYRLNETMSTYTHSTGHNMALVYTEITPPTENAPGSLRAVNAGCITPVVRLANGDILWIEVVGLPLGVDLDKKLFEYREKQIDLHKGDMIILVSDGIVEATKADRAMFGFDQLEKTIAAGPNSGAEDMLAHIKSNVNTFINNTRPHDDMTIVVIQV